MFLCVAWGLRLCGCVHKDPADYQVELAARFGLKNGKGSTKLVVSGLEESNLGMLSGGFGVRSLGRGGQIRDSEHMV